MDSNQLRAYIAELKMKENRFTRKANTVRARRDAMHLLLTVVELRDETAQSAAQAQTLADRLRGISITLDAVAHQLGAYVPCLPQEMATPPSDFISNPTTDVWDATPDGSSYQPIASEREYNSLFPEDLTSFLERHGWRLSTNGYVDRENMLHPELRLRNEDNGPYVMPLNQPKENWNTPQFSHTSPDEHHGERRMPLNPALKAVFEQTQNEINRRNELEYNGLWVAPPSEAELQLEQSRAGLVTPSVEQHVDWSGKDGGESTNGESAPFDPRNQPQIPNPEVR